MFSPRNVYVLSFAKTFTAIVEIAIWQVGIEVSVLVDMQGYVKDIWVIVEGVLNTITVMHIPIKD